MTGELFASRPGRDGPSPAAWLRQQAFESHAAIQGSDGASAQPFPSLEAVFVEQPVELDVFVRDSHFINMPNGLSTPQHAVLRAAERVYYPELYPLMAQEWGQYWAPIPVVNFLTLLVGKGGG